MSGLDELQRLRDHLKAKLGAIGFELVQTDLHMGDGPGGTGPLLIMQISPRPEAFTDADAADEIAALEQALQTNPEDKPVTKPDTTGLEGWF